MTPGGSIIFTPQTALADVQRMEATWGRNAWGIWAYLYRGAALEAEWMAVGPDTMHTVRHIHAALAEYGMSPADIERVHWRTDSGAR